jgi:hypothetical protein
MFAPSITFGATVDEGLEAFRNFRVNKIDESSIDPATRLHRVQSADYEVKLHIIIVAFVLDFAMVSVI